MKCGTGNGLPSKIWWYKTLVVVLGLSLSHCLTCLLWGKPAVRLWVAPWRGRCNLELSMASVSKEVRPWVQEPVRNQILSTSMWRSFEEDIFPAVEKQYTLFDIMVSLYHIVLWERFIGGLLQWATQALCLAVIQKSKRTGLFFFLFSPKLLPVCLQASSGLPCPIQIKTKTLKTLASTLISLHLLINCMMSP